MANDDRHAFRVRVAVVVNGLFVSKNFCGRATSYLVKRAVLPNVGIFLGRILDLRIFSNRGRFARLERAFRYFQLIVPMKATSPRNFVI